MPDTGPITDGSAATIDLAADRLAAVETANAFLHSDAFSNRSMEEDPQQQRLVVQAHDTLLKLAANRATDFANAAEINDLKNQFIATNPQLTDPNQLQVGQVLNVPTPDTPIDNAALARANAADASYQASLAAPRAEALAPLDAMSSDLDWPISTGAITASPEEPQPLAGDTSAKNPSFGDYTAFAGGLVRNSLVSVGAGLAGIGKLLVTGNVNASVDVIQNIQQTYGWQPSSAGQQSITTAVQNFAPIQYFNNFKQSAGNYVEPYGPEAATLAYMAPDAALALVMPATTQLAKGSVGAIADMAGMTRAAGSWDSVVLEEVPSSALLGTQVDENAVGLISSKSVGNTAGAGTAQTIPLGFSGKSEFAAFGQSLYGRLGDAGFGNTHAGFQGSSVTGQAFKSPFAPFDVGRVSDYDIALSSPELFDQAQSVGIGLRQQGTRTGPLLPEQLDSLGLTALSNQLAQQAGRPVNFMIYQSMDSAIGRSPTILVPRGPQ